MFGWFIDSWNNKISIFDNEQDAMESKLEEILNSLRTQHGFTWVSLISSEGLSLCQSGIDEQFELSALLPSWVKSGHDIAQAAQLEHGMGFVCLVPKQGSHALLIQDFVHNEHQFIVLIATAKLPQKTSIVLKGICDDLSKLL